MNHIFVAISGLEVGCFLRRMMIFFGFILFTENYGFFEGIAYIPLLTCTLVLEAF
jgi:hypothetical protein